MRYQKYLSRTLIIGLGLTLDKLFLLFLPYMLNNQAYNSFNQSYYLAGMISLLASLGFNFSIRSVRLSNRLILSSVLVNTILTTLLIWLLFEKGDYPLFPFLYAFMHIAVSVLQYEMLFKAEIKKYFLVVGSMFLLSLTSLFLSVLFNIDLFPLLTLLTFIILAETVYLSRGKGLTGRKNIKSFYSAGIAAFILNSSAVGILMFGKYAASNSFPVEISNSYIFASILITPVFYSGTLIERLIYTVKKELVNKSGIMIGAMAAMYMIYASVIIAAIKLFPGLLPGSVNQQYTLNIVTVMLIGSALFSALHYPLNGILFKEIKVSVQKELSIYYFLITTVFAGTGYYFFIMNSQTWLFLLIFIYGFLLCLVGIKYMVVVLGSHTDLLIGSRKY